MKTISSSTEASRTKYILHTSWTSLRAGDLITANTGYYIRYACTGINPRTWRRMCLRNLQTHSCVYECRVHSDQRVQCTIDLAQCGSLKKLDRGFISTNDPMHVELARGPNVLSILLKEVSCSVVKMTLQNAQSVVALHSVLTPDFILVSSTLCPMRWDRKEWT